MRTLRVLAACWSLRRPVTFAVIRAGFVACRSRKDVRDRPGRRGRRVSHPFGRRAADRKRSVLNPSSERGAPGFRPGRCTHTARTRRRRCVGLPSHSGPVAARYWARCRTARTGTARLLQAPSPRWRSSQSRIDSSSGLVRRCVDACRDRPGRELVIPLGSGLIN